VYDTKVYMTDEEYKEKHKNSTNVQAAVEAPIITMFLLCKSSDDADGNYTSKNTRSPRYKYRDLIQR